MDQLNQLLEVAWALMAVKASLGIPAGSQGGDRCTILPSLASSTVLVTMQTRLCPLCLQTPTAKARQGLTLCVCVRARAPTEGSRQRLDLG